MPDRALSFGAVAAAYERFRPDYPAELFDLVRHYARQPIRFALEIGAGTGKATRLFAQRGVIVTATEPDPAMLAELRRQVPPTVRTVQASWESLQDAESYDLVYAAASLHWTTPDGRWSRAVERLNPGGVFASFGGPFELADPAVAAAIHRARAPYLVSDDIPAPDGTTAADSMQWPGSELQQSTWFTDVEQSVVARRLTLSASDYVGYLSTVSAYLQLPPADRAQVLDRIAHVLPARVDVVADVTVHLARRRPRTSSQ